MKRDTTYQKDAQEWKLENQSSLKITTNKKAVGTILYQLS